MPCVYLSVRFIDHRTGFLMRLLVAADISCTKDARGFFLNRQIHVSVLICHFYPKNCFFL